VRTTVPDGGNTHGKEQKHFEELSIHTVRVTAMIYAAGFYYQGSVNVLIFIKNYTIRCIPIQEIVHFGS
jgi:hypothetical protein